MKLGLTKEELQAIIAKRLDQLEEAQQNEEHLGPYGDMLHLTAAIAYQRAAELILENNRRLEQQLAGQLAVDSQTN